MNEWLVWAANPLGDLIGWPRFLFVVLWQSTMIASVTLLVARLSRKPATRAWVLLLGLIAAVVAPTATMGLRAGGVGALSDEIVPANNPIEVDGNVAPPVDIRGNEGTFADDDNGEGQSARPPVVQFSTAHERPSEPVDARGIVGDVWTSISGVLAAAWLVTSAIVGVRLVRSYVRMRSVVGCADACHEPCVVAIVARIAERYGIAAPAVLLTDDVPSPAAFGVKPGVVLVRRGDGQLFPASGEFPAAAWEAVLRHELAHLRRRDPLSRMVVEVLVVLLPSPAIWLLRRKFHAAAEEACDDWTVYDGTSAVELADLLTTYVSQLSPNPIGSAMDSSDTKRRILRLLSTNAQSGASPAGRGRSVYAVLALALVAAVAVAQKPPQDSVPDKRAEAATTKHANEDKPVGSATDSSDVDVVSTRNQPYVIEPPDVLTIEVGKLVPISPHKIEKLDALQVVAENALEQAPIAGIYTVNTNGEVNLGPFYGKVVVAGLTEEEAAAAVLKHLSDILREPKVAITIAQMSQQYHIEGQHLVGPDGNMSLGVFGQIQVSGLTLDEAKRDIERKLLHSHFQEASIALDVHSYNSKVYYIIEDNREGGDRVTRRPITGNETVLDALANVESLRISEGTEIWIARTGNGKQQQKLVVDWDALVRGENTKTNYQLMPGDRVFVAQPRPARHRNDLQRR